MASDLILRAAARDVINTWGRHENEDVRMDLLHNDINAIPAVDAAPVVHAKWILIQNGSGVCSACNRNDHIDSLAAYCRYCGARMDGGADDGK